MAAKGDQRAELGLFAQFREGLFDFAVDGKTADLAFGENLPAVNENVELAGLTWCNLHIFGEARFERIRQTGGAWLIASSSAIQYLGGHNLNCRLSPLMLQS
jgi:hypothetical protein